jgi:hypothetical protein
MAFAQRHSLGGINPDVPEGRALQQIEAEADEAKKVPLLEQFVVQFPKDENIPWAYDQLIGVYAKAGQSDKVLETGQKLLAMDPDDVPAAQPASRPPKRRRIPRWC